jgi:hypothetical protein
LKRFRVFVRRHAKCSVTREGWRMRLQQHIRVQRMSAASQSVQIEHQGGGKDAPSVIILAPAPHYDPWELELTNQN